MDTAIGNDVSAQPTETPTISRSAARPGPAIKLELAPAPGLRGRLNLFSATLPDGRVLIQASRQPLFDGARALLAEGVAPDTVLTTRHRGSAIVAMHSTVGEAAKWTIEESDRRGLQRRRWRPHDMARASEGGVPENARGGVAEEWCASGGPRPRMEEHGTVRATDDEVTLFAPVEAEEAAA